MFRRSSAIARNPATKKLKTGLGSTFLTMNSIMKSATLNA
jgi:hypothetical protein